MSEINWGALYEDAMTVLEGDFPITVTSAEAGETSTNKPCIRTKLTIESGKYVGRVVNHMFTITADNPQAMGFFFRSMKVLGLSPEFFAAKPSTEMVANALEGKRAIVTLEAREWQGSSRESVKSWKVQENTSIPGALGGVPDMSGAGRALDTPASPGVPVIPTPTTEAPADPF